MDEETILILAVVGVVGFAVYKKSQQNNSGSTLAGIGDVLGGIDNLWNGSGGSGIGSLFG